MAGLLDMLFGGNGGSAGYAGPRPSSNDSSASTPAGGVYSGAPVRASPQGRNPFSSMFASDAGGIGGFLGKLSGNPTGDEMVMQRLGGQQAEGLAGLQKRIDSGMPPQQAVTDFISSPEGQQFFGSSQDPIGAIKGYLQLSQKPADKFSTAGPNQSVFNETTGQFTGERTPGADAQNLEDMAKLADYTPAQTRDVAGRLLQIQQAGPNGTENERALKVLVDKNLITQDMAAKVSAGVISIKPAPNDPLTGAPTGYIMVDLSKFLQSQDPKDIQTVILGANNGGPQGDGGQDSQLTTKEVPGDIIFGAGLGKLGATAGGIAGNIDPGLAAPDLNSYQSKLNTIFAGVTNLMGTNSRLASQMKQYTAMVDKSGYTSNPGDQYQALTNLREVVDKRMAAAAITIHDVTQPKEVRQQAAKDLADLRTLNADMPSQEALDASYAKFQAGQGGLADTIKQGAGKVGEVVKGVGKAIEAGKNAVTTTQKAVQGQDTSGGGNVPQAFKTEQAAAAAAAAGTLKAGDRITIGGQAGTWVD